jgi:hypothetical protein
MSESHRDPQNTGPQNTGPQNTGPRNTEPRDEAAIARGIERVREGHGANCSSVGSVIDTLFAGAVVGGAIFAAIVAALAREEARVVTPAPGEPSQPSKQAESRDPKGAP